MTGFMEADANAFGGLQPFTQRYGVELFQRGGADVTTIVTAKLSTPA